jgi:hypothetical protein
MIDASSFSNLTERLASRLDVTLNGLYSNHARSKNHIQPSRMGGRDPA